MISNRQNSRRRGRGGSSQRSSGSSSSGQRDSGNRIDSRARGNAAQLLEKYKNMARDAQMQGDRVNTEYYLQFADHYFRVLNDSRSRYEDQRPQSQSNGIDGDDDDYGDEGEPIRSGEQSQGNRDDSRRDDQRRDDGRSDPQRRDYNQRDDSRRDSQSRSDQQRDTQNRDSSRDDSRNDHSRDDPRPPQAAANGHTPYRNGAASENDAAPPPSEKAVRKRSIRSRSKTTAAPATDDAPTFDAALLPPSLGIAAEPATEEKPKRKRGRPPASETQAG